MNNKEWAESFAIFAKYEPYGIRMWADIVSVHVYCDMSVYSAEDKETLLTLGWTYDQQERYFEHETADMTTVRP